jgi:hypothetical protein
MAEVAPGTDRVNLIEAGLDAQIWLLNPDEQQLLGERLAGRFGWRTAGDLAVAESTIFTLERDDYDLTVAALGDLGIKDTRKQKRIPEFEEVAAAFGPVATYLGEHVGRGDQPELTFHVPLAGRYDLYKLIENFDRRQEYDTSIWRALWDTFSNNDHNHGEPNLSAGILLNDTTDPADRTRPANGYDEAGLVYVSQTVPQQRNSLKAEQEGEANQEGVDLNAADVTEYVVAQAKRRQAGRPLLDRPTVTRFPQYPDKNIDGYTVVPDARVGDRDQLYLGGSDVDDGWDNNGVRRVVRAT